MFLNSRTKKDFTEGGVLYGMNINKTIIDSVVKSILKEFTLDCRYRTLADFGEVFSQAEGELVSRIWVKALLSCDGFSFHQSAANAEAAIAACLRAGLERRRVRYHNNVYRIHMTNFEYIIHRELSGFTAIPLPATNAQYRNREAIGLDKEAFADFLLSFDALGPDIWSAAGRMRQTMHEMMLEQEKEAMVQKILKTAEMAGGLPTIDRV